MKAPVSIRFAPAQKQLFRAAEQAHEDLTEFLQNSAMLRIQRKLLNVKPIDPVEVMGRVFLESYDPAKVSKREAAEIERLDKLAAKGQLPGKVIGFARVKPPQRKAKATSPA